MPRLGPQLITVLIVAASAGCGSSSLSNNDGSTGGTSSSPDGAAASNADSALPAGQSREVVLVAVPEASYQAAFDAMTGYRLVFLDGYDVGGKTFFNAIFRPSDGTAWFSRHGMTAEGYQAQFNSATGQGYRLLQIETYVSFGAAGQVRYAPIFVKVDGPPFVAAHNRGADNIQMMFDQLKAEGWTPMLVSGASPGGNRVYSSLYEKRDLGSFEAADFLTLDEYRAKSDANTAAGRKLVYLDSFTHLGSPRIIAVWHEKAPAAVALHGLNAAELQAEIDRRHAEGYLTGAVTGYEDGGVAHYAAFWIK